MNILILLSILSALLSINAISIFGNQNLRNSALRIIVFKEKKAPKMLNRLKQFYNACCDKSIACMGEGMNDYNNRLTEEQKLIIETIISLCY